ncbi:MAG: CARDB domain-containing protein [Sphingomicrobium sp.]
MLLLLAATAQIMHVPNAPPQVTAPVALQRSDDAIRANLLPDLIASEVRVENDKVAHFKITNQGTADAKGSFRVAFSASGGSAREESITDLAAGQSVWVERSFRPDRPSTVPGVDDSLLLTHVDHFFVEVDVGPPLINPDPVGSLLRGPSACTNQRGCIIELNEKNNYAAFGKDQIGTWPPG